MAFDFILNTHILLYRSVKTREYLLGEWYSFIPEETFGYGTITAEFKCKKSLKLLDITKNSFYNDFRDNIIKYSKSNPILNAKKMMLLFPLGFSDSTLYTKYANELKIPKADSVDFTIELDTQYYGNRSRYSVLQLDLELILVLKDIYPDYDGIISPIKLPNTLMNGYQHSEMCIFNKDNVELIKEIPRTQSGGNITQKEPVRILGAISLDNEFTREYVSSMKEFHKTFKLITTDNIIEQQFVPHVYVSPTESISKVKNRKTRKQRKL